MLNTFASNNRFLLFHLTHHAHIFVVTHPLSHCTFHFTAKKIPTSHASHYHAPSTVKNPLTHIKLTTSPPHPLTLFLFLLQLLCHERHHQSPNILTFSLPPTSKHLPSLYHVKIVPPNYHDIYHARITSHHHISCTSPTKQPYKQPPKLHLCLTSALPK